MGCDIHPYAEVRTAIGWEVADGVHPFDSRHYGIFGFLADVRNYSRSPVLAHPRGLPDDVTALVAARADWSDAHSHSWLSLAELLAYDYEQVIWDRRITRTRPNGVLDGAALADEGEGKHLPLREFLGNSFLRRAGRSASARRSPRRPRRLLVRQLRKGNPLVRHLYNLLREWLAQWWAEVGPVRHVGALVDWSPLTIADEDSTVPASKRELAEADAALHEQLNAIELEFQDALTELIDEALRALRLDGRAALDVAGLGDTGEHRMVKA
jgi:hypothetical protein